MNKVSIASIFNLILFLSAISLVMSDGDHDHDEIVFSKLPTKLQSGLSDMTATYVEDLKGDGVEAIILTGGCTSGNVETVYDNNTYYYCQEITDEVYIFYPSTEMIVSAAKMPSKRYRHAAALVGGKLYLTGGRTLYDNLIKEVIVYDPNDGEQGSWDTFMTLDDKYVVSDHASFGRDGSIYVLGGYAGNYDARNEVFAIDVDTKNIVDLEPMGTKRGDAQAVYYDEGRIEGIYTVGGFSHETSIGFCEPLSHGEKYDFRTNKWTDIDGLQNKRGDKGLVVINKKILAIGGETKHESVCEGTEDKIDPASHSIAVDDVESYSPQDGDDAQWHVESDFPSFLFRSAAAASDKVGKVYIFGGQLAYDDTCKCFPATDDIHYFRDSGVSARNIGFAISAVVGSFIALLW